MNDLKADCAAPHSSLFKKLYIAMIDIREKLTCRNVYCGKIYARIPPYTPSECRSRRNNAITVPEPYVINIWLRDGYGFSIPTLKH